MPVLLSVILLFGMYISQRDAVSSIQESLPYTLYSGATKWLMAHTTPGERIFQTDWDDFPRLFFYDTYNTYMVGLDPTYMQLYDSDLYNQWVLVTNGKVNNLSQVIPSEFGAYYVVTDLQHKDFIAKASMDPGMREVYRDSLSVVYQILK